MFEEMGSRIAEALHGDTVRLTRPVREPDGMGGFADGAPEDLGVITGSLQSCSAELAQKAYGVVCAATKRLFCAPDGRVRPGILAGGWRVVAVPVRCHSHMIALLEEVSRPHADRG